MTANGSQQSVLNDAVGQIELSSHRVFGYRHIAARRPLLVAWRRTEGFLEHYGCTLKYLIYLYTGAFGFPPALCCSHLNLYHIRLPDNKIRCSVPFRRALHVFFEAGLV